jgi:hypothetical protein
MLAVVFGLDPDNAAAPECKRVLSRLTTLHVPYSLLGSRSIMGHGVREEIVRRFALPEGCIWYVTDRTWEETKTALASGLNAIHIGFEPGRKPQGFDGRLHVVEHVGKVLDVLAGPYTRSALMLRYLLALCNDVTE